MAWNPSTSSDVIGYRVAYAITSAANTQSLEVGNATTATISGLDDSTTYSFAVTAYNKDGVVSFPSNQVTVNPASIANLSTRVGVDNFSHVLIDGFIISGSDNVLIGGVTVDGVGSASRSAPLVLRAIGLSLAEYGITDPLYDPTLAVYDSNGTLLAFNDDWSDDPSHAGQIMASGFAPKSALESAIFALLPAANYTAVVRGWNGTQGVALFDAYQLP